MHKCNHQLIARLFNNSMTILWSDVVKYENVLLLVSDATPYMIKAGKTFKWLFPKNYLFNMFSPLNFTK